MYVWSHCWSAGWLWYKPESHWSQTPVCQFYTTEPPICRQSNARFLVCSLSRPQRDRLGKLLKRHAKTSNIWRSYNFTCYRKMLNVQFLVISKLGNHKTVHLVSPLDSFANDILLLFLGHYDESELEHYVSLVPCTVSGSIPGARHLFQYVTNHPPKAKSAFHPSRVGKWVPASAGKAKAVMVHSVSGWTRGVHIKLWDHLRTRAIPERLRGAFTMRRYTNPRLPLPLPCTGNTLSNLLPSVTNRSTQLSASTSTNAD